MEGVVERDSGAVPVETVEDATSRWREVGDGESDTIARGLCQNIFRAGWEIRKKPYLPMSTRPYRAFVVAPLNGDILVWKLVIVTGSSMTSAIPSAMLN